MVIILLIGDDEAVWTGFVTKISDAWSISRCTRFEEFQANRERFSTISGINLVLLVDWEERPEWTDRVLPWQDPRVPFIALVTTCESREAAFAAGANEYLLKPLSGAEIDGRLGRFIQDQKDLQRTIQKERQASVGRLTSFVCHEINNAMQATRGALALVTEEPDLSEDVCYYISLCQQETQRVVRLVEKIRQTYRASDEQGFIHFDHLLKESVDLVSEELNANSLNLYMEIEPELPGLEGVANQIELALLSLLLNSADVAGECGGGSALFAVYFEKAMIQSELIMCHNMPNANAHPLDLSIVRKIIADHAGQVVFEETPVGWTVRIGLPAKPAQLVHLDVEEGD